jgi:hypothetical protein
MRLEKLSETHQRWVKQLEADYRDLPMGMAEALVRLYLKKPEFFKRENLEAIKGIEVPQLNKTVGSAHIASPDEIAAIEEKLQEHRKRGELIHD